MRKLGLKYFMLSQQALSLYRQFWKVINKAPEGSRGELRLQVRMEFERYRGV